MYLITAARSLTLGKYLQGKRVHNVVLIGLLENTHYMYTLRVYPESDGSFFALMNS